MYKINPSVKMILIILIALYIPFASIKFNCAIVILFTLMSKINKRYFKLIFPALIISLSFFTSALFFGRSNSISSVDFLSMSINVGSINDALNMSLRVLSYSSMGIFFSTTIIPYEFILSLIKQLKLPLNFAYGTLYAINLIPYLNNEYKSVRLAYKLRGENISIFSIKPLFTLLVNTLNYSSCAAMAMESKGFDENKPRSYYVEVKVKAIDILFFISVVFYCLYFAFFA